MSTFARATTQRRGQNQPGSGGSRSSLHQGEWRAGHLPLMYYSHNLHFIAMCSAMNGDYAEAKKSADTLAAHVGPHVKDMPPIEGFMTIPMAVNLRFHKWNEILSMPQPDPAMKTTTVFWHFARGMALASTGKTNDAQAEYKIVSEAEKATPPDVVFTMPVNNK